MDVVSLCVDCKRQPRMRAYLLICQPCWDVDRLREPALAQFAYQPEAHEIGCRLPDNLLYPIRSTNWPGRRRWL